ncbi:hypothetical protein [Mycolicibacterium goodii]|uniref:hypothetical protein n=2 Tax=Mycolicibacterium goodii TaxID=134601 RepID=UPI00105606D3|nr:hypothetical protein [Mycolicibacterium goodii]
MTTLIESSSNARLMQHDANSATSTAWAVPTDLDPVIRIEVCALLSSFAATIATLLLVLDSRSTTRPVVRHRDRAAERHRFRRHNRILSTIHTHMGLIAPRQDDQHSRHGPRDNYPIEPCDGPSDQRSHNSTTT